MVRFRVEWLFAHDSCMGGVSTSCNSTRSVRVVRVVRVVLWCGAVEWHSFSQLLLVRSGSALSVPWPSPAMQTLPFFRTHKMVVFLNKMLLFFAVMRLSF